MRERKAGTIINISSIGDRKPAWRTGVSRLQARRALSWREHEYVGGRAQCARHQCCAGTDPHRYSPEDGDQL